MPSQPAPPHSPACPTQPIPAAPESAADHWAADSLRYRAMLSRNADMAAALAEKLFQQATAEPQPETPATDAARAPDITIRFERVSRVMRHTIALARRVAEPLPDAPTVSSHERTKARDHIIREVDDIIRDVIKNDFEGNGAKNIRDDLYCRLEDYDLDDALAKRSIPEIIAELIQDLGLAVVSGPQPFKYHTSAAIADLMARAGRPRPPPEPRLWPEPTPDRPTDVRKPSSSFLKKRTKKLSKRSR